MNISNSINWVLRGWCKTHPELQLIKLLESVQSSNQREAALIHKSILTIISQYQLKVLVDEIYNLHYKGELTSSKLKEHQLIIKILKNNSLLEKLRGNPNKELSFKLLEMYMYCKIPNSSNVLEKIRSIEIFEYFISEGLVSLSPPPKSRHLFLNSLD